MAEIYEKPVLSGNTVGLFILTNAFEEQHNFAFRSFETASPYSRGLGTLPTCFVVQGGSDCRGSRGV